MQSEDHKAQVLFWENLNIVMARHDLPRHSFKGFMADSAQANWMAIRIVYGDGSPQNEMVNKERTCLFHWAQSMIKYAKKYVLEGILRDQHKAMYHQYRIATSLAEADHLYASIRAWWMSSGAVLESRFWHLDQWLAFWHFRYLQWGGFMTEVLHL